jgi:RNase P subunit RPR2
MKKLSKKESEEEVKNFFKNIKNKNPKEVKKIVKIAMSHNIKLGQFKKTFCKKCLTPYRNPKIRIKGSIKSVRCENCEHISRWKIKLS